jgi:hypothetical protein
VTNQRLFLAASLGAVFLAIFVVTMLILLATVVPAWKEASVRDQPRPELPRATGPQIQLADPTEWRDPRVSPAPSRDGLGVRQPERFGSGYGQAGAGFDGGRSPEPYPPADWHRDRPFASGSMTERGWAEGSWPMEAYRFRPLTESERRRLESRGDSRDERSGSGSAYPDRFVGPDVVIPDGFASDWGSSPYRFRPTDPPRRQAPEPWRAIPGPQPPRSLGDPGFFQPAPQWGATPPDVPQPLPYLYPSLAPDDGHRLTVR